jgi:hypothetical protein
MNNQIEADALEIIELVNTIIKSSRLIVDKTQNRLFTQEALDTFSNVFKELHTDESVYSVMKMFSYNKRIMSDDDIKLLQCITDLHKKIT